MNKKSKISTMKKYKACEDGEGQLVTINEEGREILLFGDITPVSACQFILGLRQLDADSRGPISLLINSTGGSVFDSSAIYDAICLAKSRVIGQAYGACMSGAIFILQACDTRLAAPTCRIMVHNPYSNTSNEFDIKELRKEIKEACYVTNLYHEKLMEKSNLTLDKIKKLCEDTAYMTPEEALEFGLIDSILGQTNRSRN